MAIHGEFCARDIVYFAYILKEILAWAQIYNPFMYPSDHDQVKKFT